jgi:serine phosphatase RsbU (regulator of sigma subunit)
LLFKISEKHLTLGVGPNNEDHLNRRIKPLKTLLSGLSARPVDQQKQMLLETLLGWKGDIEQVDDICIIGVCL